MCHELTWNDPWLPHFRSCLSRMASESTYQHTRDLAETPMSMKGHKRRSLRSLAGFIVYGSSVWFRTYFVCVHTYLFFCLCIHCLSQYLLLLCHACFCRMHVLTNRPWTLFRCVNYVHACGLTSNSWIYFPDRGSLTVRNYWFVDSETAVSLTHQYAFRSV